MLQDINGNIKLSKAFTYVQYSLKNEHWSDHPNSNLTKIYNIHILVNLECWKVCLETIYFSYQRRESKKAIYSYILFFMLIGIFTADPAFE